MFLLYVVQRILFILQPVDRQLQGCETDILTGVKLVTSVIKVLKQIRADG